MSSSSAPTGKSRSVSSPPAAGGVSSPNKATRVLGEEVVLEGNDEDDEDVDSRERIWSVVPPPLSHEEMRITAQLVGAETVRGQNGGKEHTVYRLTVSTGAHASSGLQWKVSRRFREFESLHERLVSRFGADKLPALPKKALLRTLDPEYVRRKKTELARYLADLVLDPQVVASEILAHFLLASLPDLLRSNAENVRAFGERGATLQTLQTEALRHASERRDAAREATRLAEENARARDALLERVRLAEESALVTTNELTLLHTAWEQKFGELVAHAKELKSEKRTALKFVKDLDVQVRRLKQEKKLLVREVKENRAQLAALGVLGRTATGAASSANGESATITSGEETAAPSESPSGVHTPATGLSVASSPLLRASPTASPSPSHASLASSSSTTHHRELSNSLAALGTVTFTGPLTPLGAAAGLVPTADAAAANGGVAIGAPDDDAEANLLTPLTLDHAQARLASIFTQVAAAAANDPIPSPIGDTIQAQQVEAEDDTDVSAASHTESTTTTTAEVAEPSAGGALDDDLMAEHTTNEE